MSSELKSKAVKGVAWSMLETYSGQLVQFAISIILARLLSPSEFGILGMLAIFMAIANSFIDGGFSSALIQRKDKKPEDFSTVFYINSGMAILIYALLFFTAPWIADFYHQPILINVVRIYGITLILGSLGSTSSVQLTIKLDFKTSTKISLCCAIISGIIGICLAFAGWGVWALVAQSIISAALRLVLLYIFVKWLPTSGFSKSSFKELFAFSSKLFSASIISVIYDNLAGAAIGKQFNSAALAFYNRAYSFNALVNTNITNVLGKVSYPLLSQIQDDNNRLKIIYERYIQMSAFITFPALMLLCAIAKPLVLFLLTDKWSSVIIYMQILSFAMMTDGVIASNINLIKVKGRSDLLLKLEIIKKGLAFTILGISIAMDSVLAICLGKVLYGGIIALYLNTYYTKKLMGYGFLEQIKGYWPYLLASWIMLGIGLLISYLVNKPLLALIIEIPLCITIYLTICAKTKLYAYYETKKIVKPVISKMFRSKHKLQ